MALYDKVFEAHPVAIGKAISKTERYVDFGVVSFSCSSLCGGVAKAIEVWHRVRLLVWCILLT